MDGAGSPTSILSLVAELTGDDPATTVELAHVGIERAMAAVTADVGLVVEGDHIRACVGFDPRVTPGLDQIERASRTGVLEVAGRAPCHAVVTPLGPTGVLLVGRTDGPFAADEAVLVAAMAGIVGLAIRAGAAADLARAGLARADPARADASSDALVDPLTRLPNRTLFLDRFRHALEASRRSGAAVGILFMDLDRFKVVNDSLGHLAGDRVLTLLADRMRSVSRPADTLGRLGGDEFAVLVDDVSSRDVLATLAARLSAEVRRPVELDGRALRLDVSIGITTGRGDHTSVDRLLREADLAMHEAKSTKDESWVVFAPAMHDAVVERIELESDLADAVEGDQLHLVYQPIVAIATGRVAGLEALLRWDHPRRGSVPPDEFIPVAEECGAILAIGRWVLAESCAQMGRWQARHGPDLDINLAVNLSAREIEQTDLPARLAAAIGAAGLDPSTVVIEVTETSVALDHPEVVAARLEEIRGGGVGVALDDFGTGHSSIAHLRALPASIVKIDRSFVAEITDSDEHSAIAEGIISLASALGLDSVAEGVETEDQLTMLRRMGCGYAQGYLLARPLTADQVEAALRSASPSRWTLPMGTAKPTRRFAALRG